MAHGRQRDGANAQRVDAVGGRQDDVAGAQVLPADGLPSVRGGEEIAVLQAGMDQSLMALQNMSVKGSDAEAELLSKIDNLYLEHRGQMDKIMGMCFFVLYIYSLNDRLDSVLEDCKGKVSDSLFELDSTAHPGNQTATPSLLLSYLEKVSFIFSMALTSCSSRPPSQ